jgi:uncharacterized protein (TIGR02611 family)
MQGLYAGARRIVVLIAGSILVAVGIALLVLPGPGIPLILAGLALLGTQFPWARRMLEWLRARMSAAVTSARFRFRRTPMSAAGAGPSERPSEEETRLPR